MSILIGDSNNLFHMEGNISSAGSISETILQKEREPKKETPSFCIGVSNLKKKKRFLGHKNNLTWNCKLYHKSKSDLEARTRLLFHRGFSIEVEPINDVDLHSRDRFKKICSKNSAMTEDVNTNALLVNTVLIDSENDLARDLLCSTHDNTEALAESTLSNCNTALFDVVKTAKMPLPMNNPTQKPHDEGFRMAAATTDQMVYGVTYVQDLDLYRSQIQINCKNCYAGDYRLEADAAAASDVVVKYFTEADSPKYKMAETTRLNFDTTDEYKLARDIELGKRGLVGRRIGVDHSALTVQAVRYIVSFIHESESLSAPSILATPRKENSDKSTDSIIVSATKDATANDGTDLSTRSINANIETPACNDEHDSRSNRKPSQGMDNTDVSFMNKSIYTDAEISVSLGDKEESNRRIIKGSERKFTKSTFTKESHCDISLTNSNSLKRKCKRETESNSKKDSKRRTKLLNDKTTALEKKWGSLLTDDHCLQHDYIQYIQMHQAAIEARLLDLKATNHVPNNGSPGITIPESFNIQHSSSSHDASEMIGSSNQLLRLNSDQCSNVPFPIGCEVWTLSSSITVGSKGSFICGKINGISLNIGIRELVYEVLLDNGETLSLFAWELAYAPFCPVYYCPSSTFDQEHSSQGEISLCQIQPRCNDFNRDAINQLNESSSDKKIHFYYTVKITNGGGFELVEDIPADKIIYRHNIA